MKQYAAARAAAGVPDLPPDSFVILSFGMGVDSTSLLLRLILDVGSRWFRLDRLVVLIAVVGPLDEYARTQRYPEKVVSPILARHRIRTVQLARASGKAKDGYLVLDDTRAPTRLHRDRARWPLYRELIEAATVPSVSSTRRSCSDKAKHWVLGRFIADEFASRPFVHLLGFGAHEATRAERDRAYATELRHPAHPLLSWGWDRGRAEVHLRECFGSDPGRSACSYCLMWNLLGLVCPAMTTVFWDRYPRVADHAHARRWLQFTANIGRAANTVDAYGRSLEDHLKYCETAEADPLTLKGDTVAGWIGDLRERPNARSSKLVHLDSGAGLANSTIQLRIVAARSFYAFLVEDGLRELNPVRRGQSGRGGRKPKRGLVRKVEKAPWIPHETAWEAIIAAVVGESLRNRLMVALAYDGALRREELTCLEIDDFEPAYSLIHLRAETTKSQRAREVAYGEATGHLLMAYLRRRRELVGRVGGRLLLSESRRNFSAPLTVWTWPDRPRVDPVRRRRERRAVEVLRPGRGLLHLRLLRQVPAPTGLCTLPVLPAEGHQRRPGALGQGRHRPDARDRRPDRRGARRARRRPRRAHRARRTPR